MLPELKVRGIAKESQGAIIADLEAYNLGILVLVRNDGSALYGLKDIPLAINKFEKHQIDTSIVITDVRQSFYFQQLFKILELYGFQKNMRHIGFEVVSLKGGESMSSRKGNMVPARKFINDVTERVRDKFPNTPALEAIALGAIRFYMLKYSSISKIEFDIEEALKMEGATGPYVQYAHARICNISKKASDAGMDMGGSIDYSLLIHEKEILLIRELHKFPELVAEISQDYAVHKLPFYAIRLADKFHSFYDSCRVVDLQNTELSKARLALSEAVKTVLAETLRLIGVAAPEKM